MILSLGLFPQMQRTLIERFCFLGFTESSVEISQIVKHTSYIGVVRTLGLLPDAQCTLIEWFHLRILTLPSVEDRQIVERGSDIGMIRTQNLLWRYNARCKAIPPARTVLVHVEY